MNQSDLFDTHLHLDPEDNPREIFQRARLAGVTGFVIATTTYEDSLRAQQVAAQEDGVYASVGIHPHSAENFDENLAVFRELAALPKVVAIGEIGLDYYYDFSPRDRQRQVFGTFLELAEELNLPVIIHCREAYDDCLAMLRDIRPKRFLIHSYAGTPQWAEQVAELGAYFGITGMVTFKKADNIREALQAIPLDRLVLETDSPYLAPVPHRGRRNEPAYVVEVLKRTAAEKQLPTEELARVTSANARQFFNI
jgi:TatD DNase family protein